MRTISWLAAAGLVAGVAGAAAAQDHAHGHNRAQHASHGHTAHGYTGHAAHSSSRAATPSTRAFEAAHAKMMRDMAMPFTGDPDVDFRMHMIPHHQGAVDMARVALSHAKDPWTRQVAEAISVAQPREIYEFQGWLARRGTMAHGGVRADTPSTRAFKAAHAKMMRNMAMPFTGDPDVDFRMHMIPHHQGAIDMARVALRHAKDPFTRQEAEAIIIAQQQEIYEFQTWLARRRAMVPAGGQPRYIIGANSYPEKAKEEPGTRAELAGQTWAPGSGVPLQDSRP